MKSYLLTFTNELLDVYINWHCNACHPSPSTVLYTLSHLKVLCTDEYVTHGSTHDRNYVICAKKNPLFPVKLEHNTLHVTWACRAATHLIGPSFFGGPINAVFYEEVWHSSGEGLLNSSAKIVIFAIVMHSHFLCVGCYQCQNF